MLRLLQHHTTFDSHDCETQRREMEHYFTKVWMPKETFKQDKAQVNISL